MRKIDISYDIKHMMNKLKINNENSHHVFIYKKFLNIQQEHTLCFKTIIDKQLKEGQMSLHEKKMWDLKSI